MIVDKWLRNYKAIGLKLFFEKGIPIELLPKKKLLFSITFLEKVLLWDICAGYKISDAQISSDGL